MIAWTFAVADGSDGDQSAGSRAMLSSEWPVGRYAIGGKDDVGSGMDDSRIRDRWRMRWT
jgi:hypothetical protein